MLYVSTAELAIFYGFFLAYVLSSCLSPSFLSFAESLLSISLPCVFAFPPFIFDSVLFGSFGFSVPFGSVLFGSAVPFGSVRLGSVRFDSVPFRSVRLGSVLFDSVPFHFVRFGSVRFASARFGPVRFI